MKRKLYYSGKCDEKYKRKMKYVFVISSFILFSVVITIIILSYPMSLFEYIFVFVMILMNMIYIIHLFTTRNLTRHIFIFENGILPALHASPLSECTNLKPILFSRITKWNEISYYINCTDHITLVPREVPRFGRLYAGLVIGPGIYKIHNKKVPVKEKVPVQEIIKLLKRNGIKKLKLDTIEHNEKINSMLRDRYIIFTFKTTVENV